MIYCDSSALVKLVVEEPESVALEAWLGEQPGVQLVSSVLARTEVVRAVARFGPEWVAAATALLDSVAAVELDSALADEAARTGPLELRTLDALHLVSAARMRRALVAFVVYDRRLAEAALAAGLAVHAPGVVVRTDR